MRVQCLLQFLKRGIVILSLFVHLFAVMHVFLLSCLSTARKLKLAAPFCRGVFCLK